MSETSDAALLGSVEGTLIRGGTSRGLFFRDAELPDAGPVRDALLIELFGSPDPIQVDGIGGGNSHTSKAMIVEPSDRANSDVDYTFGQIAIDEPTVAWDANCGNLTAAIGVYALREGMVPATEPETEVTLYNTNTGTRVDQTVPVRGGEPDVYGEFVVDGVPGTGARIDSAFLDPAGRHGVFPTGEPRETLPIDGDSIEVSIVDITNLTVFVRAADLGLSGTELPGRIAGDEELMARLERVRGHAAARLGLVDDPGKAAQESPELPFLQLISEPQSYDCSIEDTVAANELDLTGRMLSNQHPHHAYAMTGAMCVGAAAHLPGTVPNEFLEERADELTVGHPKGTVTVGVDVERGQVESVTMRRTARLLFEGSLYYRYVDELEALR